MKISDLTEKIKNIFRQENGKKPFTAQEKWLLMLLLGLLLAVIVFPLEKKNSKESSQKFFTEFVQTSEQKETTLESENTPITSLNQYEVYLSKELEEILGQIDGAGEVKAWVTLAASSEKVLFQEENYDITELEEADSVGGTRNEKKNSTQQSIVTDNSGNPYIIKTLQPKVEGVLVVAEGAGDSTVKKNITEAVEVLFGIDTHRIKVANKNAEE